MKKITLLALCIIFMMTLYPPGVWPQSNIGPRLNIEERLFDAQIVKEGDIIEHAFIVTNTGDSTLEIKKVKPD